MTRRKQEILDLTGSEVIFRDVEVFLLDQNHGIFFHGGDIYFVYRMGKNWVFRYELSAEAAGKMMAVMVEAMQ